MPALYPFFRFTACLSLASYTSALCFYPNGNPSKDTACSTDGGDTFCCAIGFACLSNRLCHGLSEPWETNPWPLGRGSCTDVTWTNSSACPTFCRADTPNNGCQVAQCSDTTYCCGGDNGCCIQTLSIITLGTYSTLGFVMPGGFTAISPSATASQSTVINSHSPTTTLQSSTSTSQASNTTSQAPTTTSQASTTTSQSSTTTSQASTTTSQASTTTSQSSTTTSQSSISSSQPSLTSTANDISRSTTTSDPSWPESKTAGPTLTTAPPAATNPPISTVSSISKMGAGVGLAVGIAIIILGCLALFIHRRAYTQARKEIAALPQPSEPSGSAASSWFKPELSGQAPVELEALSKLPAELATAERDQELPVARD
ncbi:MAG: hypothetical protein FRX48_04734 [Lasallia pustulata]|uniref:Uncharacterized protein n=1 Tax=Lasallia pustulata TaxID=136370 RepID=A0A5M8PPN0_9LECA|nr:MAG: hypothetical protein FRX48_04734 [Lasallia pustulata]